MPDEMKKILFIQTRAPHGTLFGQEGLDAVLMGSAFVDCSVLLLGDGVWQLLAGQDVSGSLTKDFSVSYGALPDYGVSRICVSSTDLEARGLSTDDLVVPVDVLDDAGIRSLFNEVDVMLDF